MDSSTTCHNLYLTIDAGGTYLKSAVLDEIGNVKEGSQATVKAHSGESKEVILSAFSETIVRGLEFIGKAGTKLKGIGVAFPGPFDYKNGIPGMKHKFQSIYGINIREFLYQIPGVSADTLIGFIHDAHAVLSGELWKGNAQGYPDSAVVTVGTGLGFAYSKKGIIQSNKWGGPVLTLYKLPYRDGILEEYTARKGFLKIYGEISGKSIEHIDVADLGKLADEGDKNSLKTFNEVATILAGALHDFLIEMEIQCLLLGGQISKSFHHMESVLKQDLKDVECLQKITAVKNIDNAPMLGALKTVSNNQVINI